jgi:hypothetical protein
LGSGRKYGRLKYGRYTYDLWDQLWIPVPPEAPGDIWIPLPGFPPEDSWTPVSASPIVPDIWNPVSEPIAAWASAIAAPTEIWIPVTTPRFE